jgi:hypothetical protein
MLKTVTNSINASQIQTPITLAGNVTLSTGNLVIGTSGKGIDFSATPNTGTSELLSDYEEGTWTAVATSSAGAITSYTAGECTYVKVGKSVMVRGSVAITVGGTAAGELRIDGLPYTSRNYTDGAPASICLVRESALTGLSYQGILLNNNTRFVVATLTNTGVSFIDGSNYVFATTYEVA